MPGFTLLIRLGREMLEINKIKLFVIGISVFFLISCSPITRASGEVVDNNNNPVENARVQVVGKSLDPNKKIEQLTNFAGSYDFGEIYVSAELPTEIKLIVSKEGYKTIVKDLKFAESNVDRITLERVEK